MWSAIPKNMDDNVDSGGNGIDQSFCISLLMFISKNYLQYKISANFGYNFLFSYKNMYSWGIKGLNTP